MMGVPVIDAGQIIAANEAGGMDGFAVNEGEGVSLGEQAVGNAMEQIPRTGEEEKGHRQNQTKPQFWEKGTSRKGGNKIV